MIETILVPLDGSPLAERALPYAQSLAQATGARLFLVRAALAHTFPGVNPSPAEVEVVEDAEGYLQQVVSRLDPGIRTESAVFYGDPVTAIVDEIGLRNADLVVMATHGRSGLGRWVYGSVTEGVLHRSPVPVLCVRAWHSAEGAAAVVRQPRILVPLDGSSFAEAALGVAIPLAQQLAGEVIVAEVVPAAVAGLGADTFVVPPPLDLAAAREEAEAYLKAVVARLSAAPSPVPVRSEVREGDPPQEICALAQEVGAALVAMATHGRTGLGRLLMGSVAGAVLRQGTTPLLLVRPSGLAAAEETSTPAQATG